MSDMCNDKQYAVVEWLESNGTMGLDKIDHLDIVTPEPHDIGDCVKALCRQNGKVKGIFQCILRDFFGKFSSFLVFSLKIVVR